jgi:hypothetical protein
MTVKEVQQRSIYLNGKFDFIFLHAGFSVGKFLDEAFCRGTWRHFDAGS